MAISAEYGVDFLHVETLWEYGEARIALKVGKEFSKYSSELPQA